MTNPAAVKPPTRLTPEQQTAILEMLESFSKRPGMYIGPPEPDLINKLVTFFSTIFLTLRAIGFETKDRGITKLVVKRHGFIFDARHWAQKMQQRGYPPDRIIYEAAQIEKEIWFETFRYEEKGKEPYRLARRYKAHMYKRQHSRLVDTWHPDMRDRGELLRSNGDGGI